VLRKFVVQKLDRIQKFITRVYKSQKDDLCIKLNYAENNNLPFTCFHVLEFIEAENFPPSSSNFEPPSG